jgi:hypothetical protein
MKRMTLALAAGIAGAGLLAGCAPAMKVTTLNYYGKNNGGTDTYVTLLMVGKDCKVSGGVGTLGGRKNGNVVWHVNNGCDSAQYLTITHYQERKEDGTLGDVVTDVVNPDPLYSEKIGKHATDKKVRGMIVKDNTGGSKDKEYKYWICVGPNSHPPTTNCLDPDVDVWP